MCVNLCGSIPSSVFAAPPPLADLYNLKRDGPEEPEWFVREKEHFTSNRDINQDGYLDKVSGHHHGSSHYSTGALTRCQ